MIYAIIVEDETPTARRLQRMLEKENVQILDTIHSVKEGKEWFKKNNPPDLIFMDIHLSDGLGFEIINESIHDIPIIFTTAFDRYALQAFKQNSIDYLLKPVKQEDLHQALSKFKQRVGKINWKNLIQTYKQLQDQTQSYKERFLVKRGNYIHLIPINEISCFYSEDKMTHLITRNRQNYYLDESLEKIQNLLNPALFFRINRKYIIALDDIKEMLKFSNSRLKIRMKSCPENEMIVARERVKDFLKILNK